MSISVRQIVAFSLVGVLLALGAQAFIPKADRVIRAIAIHNGKAGRSQPLRLDLVLRIEESDPIGTGTLVTHPTGLARLELRSNDGIVERHVLQGGEHLAMRDGKRLAEPRAFLPPLFLLQADRELDLSSGLEQLGADLASVGLAACGEDDCYVIGDPGRVPPPWEPPRTLPEGAADELDVDLGVEDGFGAGPFDEEPQPPRLLADSFVVDPQRATIWVDLLTYEPKRLDLRNGVRVWLGPPASFGPVQLPSWIRIDEPEKRPVTFDVMAVSPVDAPAAAFSRSWLERSTSARRVPAEMAPGPLSPENP